MNCQRINSPSVVYPRTFSKSDDDLSLLITNLPSKLKPSMLERKIKKYLDNENEDLMIKFVKFSKYLEVNEGYAYIYLSDMETKKILQKSTDFFIKKKKIKFEKAIPLEELKCGLKRKKSLQIHIRKLRVRTTPEDVEEYFSQFGEVVSVELAKNSSTGKNLGYGTVRFDNRESVEKVLKAKENLILNKKIVVRAFLLKSEIEVEKNEVDGISDKIENLEGKESPILKKSSFEDLKVDTREEKIGEPKNFWEKFEERAFRINRVKTSTERPKMLHRFSMLTWGQNKDGNLRFKAQDWFEASTTHQRICNLLRNFEKSAKDI